MLSFNKDDTIVALATAPGAAAIAVIRLSGVRAFEITDSVFHSKKSSSKKIVNAKTHTLHFGFIKDGETILDEVLVSVFKSPNSYTGENIVEISCHGSSFIQQQIIQLLMRKSARMAQPGEFTLRAFLNGKLDLSQAEAVADLIASDSSASHQLAMQQMRGGFSSEIKKLRHELIHFASLIELELDFAEEDVEFANREQLKSLITKLTTHISQLISSFDLGNVIKHGVPVVIAGKPNVGKSTLLNALLNEERAIVSSIAGTTRDTIEEEITLGGIRFRFIDTAGIRETADAIESIGVNKTFEKIQQSPFIIYLFDVSETSAKDLQSEISTLRQQDLSDKFKIIPVANKIDKEDAEKLEKEFSSFEEIVFISAKEKTGLEALKEKLVSNIRSEKINLNDSIVTNARHVDALKKTNEALQNAFEGISKGVTNDFISLDIRHALFHLGEITGEISTDDLLENIFMRFCIGK